MDATQWSGLIAFGSAAASCLASRAPGGLTLAAVNAGLGAECALGWRHGLHDRVTLLLGSYYPERQPLQIALIMGVALVGILFVRALRLRRHSSWPPAALFATGAAFLLFGIETISLHAVDRLLYRPAGPILVIGWLWVMLGAATIADAINHRRRWRPDRRQPLRRADRD